MNNFDTNKDVAIKDCLTTLNLIGYQMAELARIKEELESRLNALLEHPEEGSKTYTHDRYKVTITSGWNYTLNKDEYESIGARLEPGFNPVKIRQAYDLDKSIIRNAEKYGSKETLQIMSEIISKKAKKIHVKISAGI